MMCVNGSYFNGLNPEALKGYILIVPDSNPRAEGFHLIHTQRIESEVLLHFDESTIIFEENDLVWYFVFCDRSPCKIFQMISKKQRQGFP